MKNQKRSVWLFAVLLFVGLLIAYVVWSVMNMQESGWIVLLIFAPLILFFFYSGIIGELGVKDFKLVFREAANQPVKGEYGEIAPSRDDMIQVGDQGIALLEEMLAHYSLSEEKPIVMFIRLGETYPREVTLGFIEKLSRYHSFKFIVFIDQENQFVAYIPAWAIRQRLSKPTLGDEFLEIIQNAGRRNELFNYPNVIRKTIKTGSKNLEALQLMDELNLSAILVIDEDEKVQGVTERDQVISQMMLKLVE